MSLLEKALKTPNRNYRRPDIEEVEVVVAWLEGKINSKQAASVLGVNHTNLHSLVGPLIRNAFQHGMVKVELVEK